jgi:hypothetical protein
MKNICFEESSVKRWISTTYWALNARKRIKMLKPLI